MIANYVNVLQGNLLSRVFFSSGLCLCSTEHLYRHSYTQAHMNHGNLKGFLNLKIPPGFRSFAALLVIYAKG